MSDEQAPRQSSPNRQSEVAQEIFARERGLNRAMPLDEFLLMVEAQTRVQIEEERVQERRRDVRRRQQHPLTPDDQDRRQQDRREKPV